jgi:hypothetical protein
MTELALKLFQAEERIRELELEIQTLRKYVTKQMWPVTHRIPSDQWLTRKPSDLSTEEKQSHEEIEFRKRAITVIDTSVIEDLKISNKEIQLKVPPLPLF